MRGELVGLVRRPFYVSGVVIGASLFPGRRLLHKEYVHYTEELVRHLLSFSNLLVTKVQC